MPITAKPPEHIRTDTRQKLNKVAIDERAAES